MKLNHLRRRAERWTDLLVGYLAGLDDVSDMRHRPRSGQGLRAGPAVPVRPAGRATGLAAGAGLARAAFRQGLAPVSPNADLNARIASSILSCFPAELFDSTGLFRSLWLMRLYNVTSDVQGMIEDLLSVEQPAGLGGSSRSQPSSDRRRFGRS